MKRLLLIISVLMFGVCGLAAKAKPKVNNKSFPYLGIHVHPIPLPCPGVDLGYRYKFNKSAIDVALKYTTAIVANAFQVDVNYYGYADSFYLGSGARAVVGFTKEGNIGVLSFNFIIGKEFRKVRKSPTFVQMEIYYPNYIYSHEELVLSPGINFKYGWGF